MRSGNIFLLLLLFQATAGLTGVAYGQSEIKAPSVRIEGEVKTPVSLTIQDIDKLPRTAVTLKDRNGLAHSFTGVEVGLVLKNAGVTLAGELRGKNLSKYLLVEASDGYQVLFSLAEVDTAFTDRKIILANRKDGSLLTADEGPFRIIIEGEKRLSRSARQVIALKILYAK